MFLHDSNVSLDKFFEFLDFTVLLISGLFLVLTVPENAFPSLDEYE